MSELLKLEIDATLQPYPIATLYIGLHIKQVPQNRHTDDRQTERQTNRQTHTQTERHTDRKSHRQTDTHMTHVQTHNDRQTYRQNKMLEMHFKLRFHTYHYEKVLNTLNNRITTIN